MKRGGDDLQDDFVPEEFNALSADEDEDFSDPPAEGKSTTSELTHQQSEEVASQKKKRKREKEKQRKAKKRKLAESAGLVQTNIASQSQSELAAFLSSIQRKTFPKLSTLELDDLRIHEKHIRDTTRWHEPRTLDKFAAFIAKVLPRTRLRQGSLNNGSPTLIIAAIAASRVSDIVRILGASKLLGPKSREVASLTGKQKLDQQITYLKETNVGMAVGTPGRIGKLLESGALSLSALSHIVLDVTFRDVKERSMLDMPETRDDLFLSVLGFTALREAINAGKVQLVLF